MKSAYGKRAKNCREKGGRCLSCFKGSVYDYREAWLSGMGACHLCLKSFSVCVRKIEIARQSLSNCQALVTVMIVFYAP